MAASARSAAAEPPPPRTHAEDIASAIALDLGSCGDDGLDVDPTPERLNGSESYEFEPDDIERANNASEEVQE